MFDGVNICGRLYNGWILVGFDSLFLYFSTEYGEKLIYSLWNQKFNIEEKTKKNNKWLYIRLLAMSRQSWKSTCLANTQTPQLQLDTNVKPNKSSLQHENMTNEANCKASKLIRTQNTCILIDMQSMLWTTLASDQTLKEIEALEKLVFNHMENHQRQFYFYRNTWNKWNT